MSKKTSKHKNKLNKQTIDSKKINSKSSDIKLNDGTHQIKRYPNNTSNLKNVGETPHSNSLGKAEIVSKKTSNIDSKVKSETSIKTVKKNTGKSEFINSLSKINLKEVNIKKSVASLKLAKDLIKNEETLINLKSKVKTKITEGSEKIKDIIAEEKATTKITKSHLEKMTVRYIKGERFDEVKLNYRNSNLQKLDFRNRPGMSDRYSTLMRFNNESGKNDFSKLNSDALKNESKAIKIQTADIYNAGNSRRVSANTTVAKREVKTTAQRKEISSSEAMDKVLSISKSAFVNGTIILAVGTIGLGLTVFFTGYDPIPLIEKHFIYTSKDEGLNVAEITVLTGLDTSTDFPTEDEFNKLYQLVNVDFGEVVLDQEAFSSGREAFNSKIRKYYTEDLIVNSLANDVLYNTLDNIYSSENRYPYSVTLTSIGKVVKNSKVMTKLSVDINAVDDDLGFHVWNIALFLNSDYKINEIKVLAENKTMKNTRTPLDPSLAVITNGINDSMVRSLNTFYKGMTNETLCNKLSAGSKSFSQSQLKAFFSKLNLQEKDYDVLTEMFELSRGNCSNFAITEVISTDFDGEPITDIIMSIQVGDDIYRYDLQYNRRDKALIAIAKL